MPLSKITPDSLGGVPAFSAYANANQVISNATYTKVSFQAENFDTASAFDSTTNYRFTPQVAGYYQLNGQMQWTSATGAAGYSNLNFYKNGSEVSRSGLALNTYGSNGSCLIYLNGSTDYAEMFVFQVTGGNLTLNSVGGAAAQFSGSFVRAA